MRSLSILATLALAFLSTVHAALLIPRQVPACSTKCLQPGYVSPGSCSQSDNACLCKSKEFVQGVLDCITGSCPSQSDIDTTVKYANLVCQALGIKDSPPGVTTAAPGQPKPTGAAATSPAAAPTTSKPGAAPATVGVNQPLVLFGAVAIALGVAL